MNLQLLTQREQLMEDIDNIVETFQEDELFDLNDWDDRNELIKVLCDAVCENIK